MAVTDTNWIIGLSLMFGLALVFTFLTYKDMESFFIFLTIFCGFIVWSGLLPLWILVINLITLTLILFNTTYKKIFYSKG